jgi:hypothetical protein
MPPPLSNSSGTTDIVGMSASREETGQDARSASRISHVFEVELKLRGAPYPFVSTTTRTINVSATGMLLEIPHGIGIKEGQEVSVLIHWLGGKYESTGVVARIDAQIPNDPASASMGVKLADPLPAVLLDG